MRKDGAVCFCLPDCHVPGIRPLIAAYLMLLLLVAGVARIQRRSVDVGLSAPAFAFWRCPLSHVDCYVLFARRDDGRPNVARRWRQICPQREA
jgi:hypothetical protein